MSMETEAGKPLKKLKISPETEALKPHKKSNELPISLIESEILPKLPAKSVGRFKGVCKRWKSFLSSPTFGRMHFQYHGTTINDHKLLLLDGATIRKLPFTDTIPYNPNPGSIDAIVLASLDGLVLLASTTKPNELVNWNPLTGAYRKLSCIDPDDIFRYCSSFDVVGFYKDSSNDYKLLYLNHGGDYGAYIYSKRLNSWKEIEFPFAFKKMRETEDSFCSWSPATLLGKSLYFIVTAYNWIPERYSWIICFDVNTETFKKILFPPVLDAVSRDYCGSLVVLNGSIHLCVNDMKNNHGDLWRMTDDDRWMKVATAGYWFGSQQHICTATAGDWIAVLDQENNSFGKVNTEDFKARYR